MIYWSYQVLISFVKLALNNVINSNMFSITWKHYNYLANFNFIFKVCYQIAHLGSWMMMKNWESSHQVLDIVLDYYLCCFRSDN